jgi:hypothetical protein
MDKVNREQSRELRHTKVQRRLFDCASAQASK